MANRSKGIQGLFDFFGFGKKADEAAETRDVQKRIEEKTKFDETTKPGEFKKGDTTVDAETGDVVTQEYSYRPESFTDTQKRTGVGSYSDDSLREQYIDSVDADVMSFDEFVIKKRGITPEQLEAERLAKAKPVGETTTTGSRPTAENFIQRVLTSSPLIRTEEQVRQAIVNIANRGYEAGDPKLMSIDDDASISAFLDNKLMYSQREMEDFIDEFFEELKDMGISETREIDGILMKSLEGEQKAIYEAAEKTNKEVAQRAEESLSVLKMLEDMGIDTSSIDKDPFTFPPTTDDTVGFKQFATEVEKLGELFQREIGSARGLKAEDIGKSLDAINAQAAADQALADQLMSEVIQKAETGQFGSRKEAQKALTEIKEKFDKIPKAREDAIKSGVYVSPFDTKRTLNAEGGRIGFAEGGGPKFSRRGFLQGLGALGASLLLPFGRGAKEVAPVVTKAIQPVAGMPSWFPLLVNRIRSKGKVTREPGYKEFTSGGDTEKVYKLDDYTVYEDMATGKITVTGRGNDYQQVSMEYTPGENKVMTKKNPLTGVMDRGVVTERPKFEAGEFSKGEYQDFENTGVDYDDLKGDVSNWEKFATGGRKTDEKTVQQALDDFIKQQTDPNIIDDMAKGGRVGMAQGGIASKFKERVHYGN
jgi:hypothetical protein|tara:strand:+ start:705 stop:2651 length:1947 start_codon:yes stop_codon:yes gene_type:complete